MTVAPHIPLVIERLSAKGKGISRFQDAKVEIPLSLPGDEVLISLGRKKYGVYQGVLESITSPSSMRAQTRCAHVSTCGGCVVQQMHYAEQLKEKERRVHALFAPLLHKVEMHSILAAEEPWGYRNKMEFSFSQSKSGEKFFGLMQARGKVFSLKECHLAPPWMAQAVCLVRSWWERGDVRAYHPPSNGGCLRTLTLREGVRTGQKMAMLTVSGNPSFPLPRSQIQSFVKTLQEGIDPDISLFVRVQQIARKRPTEFYEMHLGGPAYIEEVLEVGGQRLVCAISPSSFFQTNTRQAEKLFARALELVQIPKKAHVLDLYCGTGVLGLLCAPYAEKVTAIEMNPYAVYDAEMNVQRNQVTNVDLIRGDVGKWLTKTGLKMPPDLLILDPPRSGLDAKTLDLLLAVQSKEILYISCNPSTQVENLVTLIQAGYELVHVQPVDQFPHTLHIENIAVLRKHTHKY